ncbi:hypothetical protein [Syntrophus aciditrophicus]|uniref:hypothetical protein n=1 Tax=Syntrophus aciditrophicus TaxID=316277 RepID=UPI0011D044C9|nr:hypothetical protein [Syntrophus aciditrophicus]
MIPRWIMTVLTVSSYCIVIFRFFLDYGGHAMHIFKDVIAYFQADPGRIFGWPFFFLAVGLNVWLVYDAFRRRRIAREKEAAAEQDRRIRAAIQNAMQYNALAVAINELRERAGLPAIDFFDENTIREMASPRS